MLLDIRSLSKPCTCCGGSGAWEHRLINLSNDLWLQFLIGKSTFTVTTYSVPFCKSAVQYTECCILFKREQKLKGPFFDYLEEGLAVKGYQRFEEVMPLDIIKRFFKFTKQNSYRRVDTDFIEDILKYYNMLNKKYFCNNCGGEIPQDNKLCWACEHGL